VHGRGVWLCQTSLVLCPASLVREHAARQRDHELRERFDLAVDRDRPAVRVRDNIVGDRQAQTGALGARLGGEEGLEQLIPDVSGNAGAVVANVDFHPVSGLLRGDPQRGHEVGGRIVSRSHVRGVEAVAEQVQENPRDVLRVDLDRRDAFAEIPFQRDIEALILRAGAVVGEVQRLIDQRVQIDHAPLARRPA